jgi:hypothetical protein
MPKISQIYTKDLANLHKKAGVTRQYIQVEITLRQVH